ncbi:hypothetical protein AAE478_001054 [Parahypoxylon ruwenzoriense]
MSQLPEGTLGDAIGVLIYTFEHAADSSSLWTDLMWAQLYYIKANYENADVAFNNGNFGFMRVMANIRAWKLHNFSIHVTISVYGYWSTRRRAERTFSLASKVIPLILAGITIGLLQTRLVQSSFAAYMVIANFQSVTSCAISIILISVILFKYIDMKCSWRRVHTRRPFKTRWLPFGNKDTSRANSGIFEGNVVLPAVFDDNWLVIRLSIAIILISIFILASVITHLPQRDDVARDAQADAPDLSPERARSNITGYIFGVTPGLAIWIVFGLTKAFRQTMYEKLVPYQWRRQGSDAQLLPQSSWTQSISTTDTSGTSRSNPEGPEMGVEFPLQDLDRNTRRR